LEEKINERLMPMFDENIFVAYESTIPADRDFELRERQANLGSYLTTVNEERVKLGMEEVEWGKVPLAPPTIAPLGSQQQPGAPGAGSEEEEIEEEEMNEEEQTPENSEGDLSQLTEDELSATEKNIATKHDLDVFVDNVVKAVKSKLIHKQSIIF
jgi:hypothetical protein